MERSPKSLVCARGTGLLSLLSDFFHHRQFNFKGTAAFKSLPDMLLLLLDKMQNPERIKNSLLKQKEFEVNNYQNEILKARINQLPFLLN